MFTPTLMTLNDTLPFHQVALVRHRLLEPWRDTSKKYEHGWSLTSLG